MAGSLHFFYFISCQKWIKNLFCCNALYFIHCQIENILSISILSSKLKTSTKRISGWNIESTEDLFQLELFINEMLTGRGKLLLAEILTSWKLLIWETLQLFDILIEGLMAHSKNLLALHNEVCFILLQTLIKQNFVIEFHLDSIDSNTFWEFFN